MKYNIDTRALTMIADYLSRGLDHEAVEFRDRKLREANEALECVHNRYVKQCELLAELQNDGRSTDNVESELESLEKQSAEIGAYISDLELAI